jgi:predicted metal-dependent phosphoesterase TrpH
MVRVDLHVHTSFGSPCAELLKPAFLRAAMEKMKIHGIVVTEHNVVWPKADMESLNRLLPKGFRIYSGVEVSTSLFHVVIIGLDSMTGVTPGMRLESLLDISEKNNAAAILVHPFDTCDNPVAMPVICDFDGIEVVSTTTRGEKILKTLALCENRTTSPVGGSDAHCVENIGKAFTAFPDLPRDEKELADQIKRGMGRPMIMTGEGREVFVC